MCYVTSELYNIKEEINNVSGYFQEKNIRGKVWCADVIGILFLKNVKIHIYAPLNGSQICQPHRGAIFCHVSTLKKSHMQQCDFVYSDMQFCFSHKHQEHIYPQCSGRKHL